MSMIKLTNNKWPVISLDEFDERLANRAAHIYTESTVFLAMSLHGEALIQFQVHHFWLIENKSVHGFLLKIIKAW